MATLYTPIEDRTSFFSEQGSEITSRITEDAQGFITDALINLYQNPYYAVAREVMTNAYDAMVKAGVTPRIEVWTPGVLSSSHEVSISDTGTGMPLEVLVNNFVNYGQSTKRASDEETGFYGLGAKSPWAICETFTVVTHCADDHYAVVMLRDETGTGRPRVFEVEPQGGNGTTVVLPLKSSDEVERFIDEMKRVAYAFPPGSVILDGEELESMDTSARRYECEIDGQRHGLWWVEQAPYFFGAGLYVRMSNILYPLDNIPELDQTWQYLWQSHEHALIIDVPNRSVLPTPDRDRLRETAANREKLGRIWADLTDSLPHIISSYTESMTRLEAVRAFSPLAKVVGMGGVPWRGENLPFMIHTGSGGDFLVEEWEFDDHSSPKITRRRRSTTLTPSTNKVIFKITRENLEKRSKMHHFLRSLDSLWVQFVTYTPGTDVSWLADLPAYTWEDVEETWKTRPANTSPAVTYFYQYKETMGKASLQDIAQEFEGKKIVAYPHALRGLRGLAELDVVWVSIDGAKTLKAYRKRAEQAGIEYHVYSDDYDKELGEKRRTEFELLRDEDFFPRVCLFAYLSSLNYGEQDRVFPQMHNPQQCEFFDSLEGTTLHQRWVQAQREGEAFGVTSQGIIFRDLPSEAREAWTSFPQQFREEGKTMFQGVGFGDWLKEKSPFIYQYVYRELRGMDPIPTPLEEEVRAYVFAKFGE